MNRIDKKFKELKNKGRPAFIAFITAGFPDLSLTAKLVLEMEKNGADIIELGVPFSDPLADGPVIQDASAQALKNGVNLCKILSLVKRLRKVTQVPICLMTYYNPVFCFGEKKFAQEAFLAGVDGVIVPDLPFEEAKEFSRSLLSKGIYNISFLTPTSSAQRIKNIAASARGFIYYVSLTGVTGSRKSLNADLRSRILALKKTVKKPLCVGFGVSNPEQVRQIFRFADGVIVGSAIVSQIKKNTGRAGLAQKTGKFVRRLANV